MKETIEFDMMQLLMMKVLIDNDLRAHRKKYGFHPNGTNNTVRGEMERLQKGFEDAIIRLQEKTAN